MAVLSVQISTTGQIPNTSGLGLGLTQQTPTPIYINTNDTLATVTTTGYLNASVTHFQYPYTNWQMAEVYTTDSGVVWLRVNITFSSGLPVYSLVAPSESGSITTPTVANQITYATNTLGTLAAAGLATALFNAGNISAGKSGTAGALFSFPSSGSKGSLKLAATASTGDTITTITNAAQAAARTFTIPDGGQSASSFLITDSASTQTIATGSLALTLGNLTVAAGNIAATLGSVAAGTTVTAGTGITATTGNITASQGNLVAGSSGHAGTVTSFPSTAANGSLILAAANDSGNKTTTVSNGTMGQNTVYTIGDIGAATGGLVVATSAVRTKFVAQAVVAGGAATQTVTDAFCTSASMVVATYNDTTNACVIQKVAAGNGSFVVTTDTDPGASHLNYIIAK